MVFVKCAQMWQGASVGARVVFYLGSTKKYCQSLGQYTGRH